MYTVRVIIVGRKKSLVGLFLTFSMMGPFFLPISILGAQVTDSNISMQKKVVHRVSQKYNLFRQKELEVAQSITRVLSQQELPVSVNKEKRKMEWQKKGIAGLIIGAPLASLIASFYIGGFQNCSNTVMPSISYRLSIGAGMAAATVGVGYWYWNSRKKYSENDGNKKRAMPSLLGYTLGPLSIGLLAAKVVGDPRMSSLFLITTGLAIGGVSYDHFVDCADRVTKLTKITTALGNMGCKQKQSQYVRQVIDDYVDACKGSGRYPISTKKADIDLSIVKSLCPDEAPALSEQKLEVDIAIETILKNWDIKHVAVAIDKEYNCLKNQSIKDLLHSWSKLPDAKALHAGIISDSSVDVCLGYIPDALRELTNCLDDAICTEIHWSTQDAQTKNNVHNIFSDSNKPIADDPFYPYVIEKIAKRGDIYIFRGDMHGSIQDFVAFLKNLEMKQFLSITDEKITIKDNVHIVFHGDYVDKGDYGIEVLWLLTHLKVNNSKQVILIRGNHEDYGINSKSEFNKELKSKFSPDEQTAIIDYFSRACELMPVSFYLGMKNEQKENQIDYIQCVHGSFDPGFSPIDHNVYSEDAQKNKLKNTYKGTFIKDLLQQDFFTLHESFIGSMPTSFSGKLFNSTIENLLKENDKRQRLLFLWGDFYHNKDIKTAFGCDYGRIALSARSAYLIFNEHSNEKRILRKLVRGHQHLPCNTLDIMPTFFNVDKQSSLYGISDLWPDGDNIAQEAHQYSDSWTLLNEKDRSQKNYSDEKRQQIITLPVASRSILGYDQKSQQPLYNDLGDAYLILHVGDSYDESDFRAIRFDHDGNDKDGNNSNIDNKEKKNEDNDEEETESPKRQQKNDNSNS